MSKQSIITVLAALVIGLGGGYWVAGQMPAGTPQATGAGAEPAAADAGRKVLFYRNPMNPAITSPVPAKDEMGMDYIPVYADEDKPGERKILFYRNPMNPAITSPVPAKDEMGMDYIPVYADGDDGGDEPAGTVKIDPVTVQNIGVRTVEATHRNLSHTIRAVGRVDYDEQRLVRLHPKASGWIEKMFIDTTGQPVEKDDIMLSIYSPQLVTTQQEYLLALDNARALADSPYDEIRAGAEDLVRSARQRLELLDVPEHQIRELEKTRKVMKSLHIHSPARGVVMKVGARLGQYVTPQTELYMLADLSKVWVYVDVYEYELPWIRVGDTASMQVAAVPGRVFKGKVAYIYPYLESKTRTNRVRIEFDNEDLILKPEMFANVTLDAGGKYHVLAVPEEAIVRSGSREQVFVVRGPGKFEPREVRLGLSSNGLVQIISGVKLGEQVVVSAQFLIDSESKLREATAKMLESLKQPAAGAEDTMPDTGADTAGDGGGHDMPGMEHAPDQGMSHD